MRWMIGKGRRLRVLDVEGPVDQLHLPRWVVLGTGSGVGNEVIVGNPVFVGPLHGVSLCLLFLDSHSVERTDQ